MTDRLTHTDLLAGYAAGKATPGLSLLVAAHLERAPASRSSVAGMEAMGGAFLAEGAPAAMSADALDRVLRMIGTDVVPAPPRPARPSGPFPAAVEDALGIDVAAIPWRFRLPGLSEYVLEGYGEERVSLLRARPGTGIPQHTHEGTEVTLVMTGAMEDGGIVYEAGDIAIGDEDLDHHPRIVGDEPCHCLIVMNGSLRFTGRFSRALNYLAE